MCEHQGVILEWKNTSEYRNIGNVKTMIFPTSGQLLISGLAYKWDELAVPFQHQSPSLGLSLKVELYHHW